MLVVSILHLTLELDGVDSLKGKRSIVKSLKEQMQHRFRLSVAEVDSNDSLARAAIAAAVVSNSKTHGEEVLAKVLSFAEEHAQARIAARRRQAAEAQQHLAAAKALYDKGTNPEQAQYVPYLVGYVAFYGGDYQTALAELQKGNQNDPFILSLIAQAYERLGDKDKATEYYRKVLTSNGHSPTNAYARPLAKAKLGVK